LFEEEGSKLAERERKCRAGEVLCGECKTDLVGKLNKFLEQHRKRREKAKDVIEQYHIKR
jgi:tryptophanyl-tRNA synthetase